MLKKIWNDPVGSKVIAAVIIAVGAFVLSVVYGAITEMSIEQSFKVLWNFEVRISYAIIVLISFLLIKAVFQKFAGKRLTKDERLREEFHKTYKKIENKEEGVIYRFNAYISTTRNFPFIADLRVYCTLHDVEALLNPSGGCTNSRCERHGVMYGYNEELVEQQIETYLLNEWESING